MVAWCSMWILSTQRRHECRGSGLNPWNDAMSLEADCLWRCPCCVSRANFPYLPLFQLFSPRTKPRFRVAQKFLGHPDDLSGPDRSWEALRLWRRRSTRSFGEPRILISLVDLVDIDPCVEQGIAWKRKLWFALAKIHSTSQWSQACGFWLADHAMTAMMPGEGHHLLDFWQFLCCSVPHLCPKSQDFRAHRALLQLPQCIISTTRGPETEMFESLKMLDDMKQTWQIICILGQQSLNSIFWSCISTYSMPFEGTGRNCMGMILKTTHLSSVCLTGSDDMHKLEIIYHSPPARWGSLDFMRVTCSSSSSCFLLPSLLPPSGP